jgi:hypothetical protein
MLRMKAAVHDALWFLSRLCARVPLQEKNRFTNDGVLVLQSQRHRTQA